MVDDVDNVDMFDDVLVYSYEDEEDAEEYLKYEEDYGVG